MKRHNGTRLLKSGTKRHMARKTRLLLVGGDAQKQALRAALPNCEVHVADNALAGVWQSGREDFGRAFVSLVPGAKALRIVQSLRQAAPDIRLVVGCRPFDEPLARQALTHGADEYILEPIRRADVERAFGEARARRHADPQPAAGAAARVIGKLSDVLRRMDDGVEPALELLTALLKETFEAEGASIQFNDISCSAGETETLVLEEKLLVRNKAVGQVALARRARGTYAAETAARLAEYARLIETILAQTSQRLYWREQAWTDDLSGLHNRRYFERTLDRLLEHAAAKRLRLTVLLFDIDGFKTYNDSYGHDVGDELIKEVALLLRRCTRESDIVARYGGDEFAVVFWDAEKQRVPGSEHPHTPADLAERFCKAIAKHDFHCLGAGAPGPITISGGLASFPWNGATCQLLMRAADAALLQAKQSGKNQIQLATKTEVPPEPTATD